MQTTMTEMQSNTIGSVSDMNRLTENDASADHRPVNQGRLEQREEGVRLILTEAGGQSLRPMCSPIRVRQADLAGGTLLSSTRYIHYGVMEFVMRRPRHSIARNADVR